MNNVYWFISGELPSFVLSRILGEGTTIVPNTVANVCFILDP